MGLLVLELLVAELLVAELLTAELLAAELLAAEHLTRYPGARRKSTMKLADLLSRSCFEQTFPAYF